MRVSVLCLFMLAGCGAWDAAENARTPAEAIYLLKKDEIGNKSTNPYDTNPKYQAVYCRTDSIEFRTTASACADAKGTARPASF